MSGLLDVELLVHVHGFLIHPHQHGLEITVADRQVIRVHQHLPTGDIDLVLQGDRNTLRRESLLQLTLVGDDALYLRGLPGRQRHHRISLTHDTASHLAAKPTEIQIRAQHVLHRITEVLVVTIQVDRHVLSYQGVRSLFSTTLSPSKADKGIYVISGISSGSTKRL
jgi:hypothetical protein